MRTRFHEDFDGELVEVATWEDDSWAGIRPRGQSTTGGTVFIFDVDRPNSWIRVWCDAFGPRIRFRFLTHEPLGSVARRRVTWFMDVSVPDRIDWALQSKKNPYPPLVGHLSPGFEPEPYVLLGELHPIWTGDRSWVQLGEEGTPCV